LAAQGWIIAIILIVSFLSILAFTRVGFILFWRATTPEDNPKEEAYTAYQDLPEQAPARNDKSVYLLLVGLIVYVVCAAQF
jgi:multicomponent K+:H+ antiporter subunit D